jgi:hypothetical protein
LDGIDETGDNDNENFMPMAEEIAEYSEDEESKEEEDEEEEFRKKTTQDLIKDGQNKKIQNEKSKFGSLV